MHRDTTHNKGVNHRKTSLVLLCLLGALLLALSTPFLVPSDVRAQGCGGESTAPACSLQGQNQSLQPLGQQQLRQDQAVNCLLVVPANPLSTQGLATPYVLAGPRGPNIRNRQRLNLGQCHENNPNGAAFVQATVFDPATSQVSVYNPLVIDAGTQPAIAPVVPMLPANAIVGIWVGFNGNNLTLVDTQGSLIQGNCINGLPGSIFGQNAFCNAPAFFQAITQAIGAGTLTPPPLGMANDGKTCPSSRDFSLVDQDQSDNTTTQYLVTAGGQTAQDNPQNRAQLQGTQMAFNGSDERVLAIALDRALGCTPWMVADLADPAHTQMGTAWPLGELQAAADQAAPIALVPALDPFVLVDNVPNLQKLNAYRLGVDQPPVASLAEADTTMYCQNLLQVGLPRIAADKQLLANAPSPFPNMANNLFTFLAQRFMNTFSDMQGFLHCTKLLGVQNPVTVQMLGGVAVNAQINLNSTQSGLVPITGGQGNVLCPPGAQQGQGQESAMCCLSIQEQGQPMLVCGSPTNNDVVPQQATPAGNGNTPAGDNQDSG